MTVKGIAGIAGIRQQLEDPVACNPYGDRASQIRYCEFNVAILSTKWYSCFEGNRQSIVVAWKKTALTYCFHTEHGLIQKQRRAVNH